MAWYDVFKLWWYAFHSPPSKNIEGGICRSPFIPDIRGENVKPKMTDAKFIIKPDNSITMTTHELAKELLELPDVKVILSRDAEGNGYSPCSSVVPTRYVPKSTCRGDILSDDDDAEYDDVEDVVVLFPNG